MLWAGGMAAVVARFVLLFEEPGTPTWTEIVNRAAGGSFIVCGLIVPDHRSSQPKVKTYTRVPGPSNVISKVCWRMGMRWRTSWYMRGSRSMPSPDCSTSSP